MLRLFIYPVMRYIGITLYVCLVLCLVRATPPERMNRYWWNFTQLQYTTWGCARRRIIQVHIISRYRVDYKKVGTALSFCDLTHRILFIFRNIVRAWQVIYRFPPRVTENNSTILDVLEVTKYMCISMRVVSEDLYCIYNQTVTHKECFKCIPVLYAYIWTTKHFLSHCNVTLGKKKGI